MVKKIFSFLVISSLGVLLSGCVAPDIKIHKSGSFGSGKTNTEVKIGSFSAKEAFVFLEPEIERTFLHESARLGKIRGMNFDKNGKAFSWSFYYYSENKKNKDYFDESRFEWSNNQPFTSRSKVFSKGNTSPEYDYLREDLGVNWLDSEDIVRKTAGFVPGIGLENISMELLWNTDISKSFPIWKVETNITSTKELIFNAVTGEKIQ